MSPDVNEANIIIGGIILALVIVVIVIADWNVRRRRPIPNHRSDDDA